MCDGGQQMETDVAAVEYYDLHETERAMMREGADPNPATLAEWDRIDAGLKALCLS